MSRRWQKSYADRHFRETTTHQLEKNHARCYLCNRYDSVTILFGKGDGTYEPAQSLTVGAQPSGLVVVDLNRDGKPDIATANYSSSNVSILYNRISR